MIIALLTLTVNSVIIIMKGGENVDVGGIIQTINNVGFPIAVCVALMWNTVRTQEQHGEETKQFTDALNKNTLVLSRLCSDLEKESEVNEVIG